MTGQRFNRWTAVRYAGDQKWLCRCDCGTEKLIRGGSLRRESTKGCRRCRRYPGPIHGCVGTKVHRAWAGMIQRCCNPNCREYPYYGGRGIAVCEEWRQSFEAFRDWALANGFADDLTLDRRDNMSGYSPGNCRWTTKKVQARNRRSNRIVEWRGERLSVAELAERTGVKQHTLHRRINSGWPLERAIIPPSR